MHSDGSALTSRDANHGAEAEGGAYTGPTAERIESIDVGEKATGTAAPEQLATADRKMFPGFVRTIEEVRDTHFHFLCKFGGVDPFAMPFLC